MNTWLKASVLFLLPLLAAAQSPDQVRRAAISGSGGAAGKCTVEVRVDIAAEVDIYGDSGRLRTLAGQPSQWIRFECSAPLPYSMSDFRFRGIDGRGTVKLLQDPRNNQSIAVIRIDDSRGGSEAYTFDIEWSGASGGAPTGGFPSVTSPGTWGDPPSTDTSARGRRGASVRGRSRTAGLTPERAVELCRTELLSRAQNDYKLRNINVTAAGIDSNPNRSDWVTGAFTARTGSFRSSASYQFNCQLDYSTAQVRSLEVLRPDGTLLTPSSPSSPSTWGTSPSTTSEASQPSLIRACQDAAVARANRDGYQNISFTTTAIDSRRSDWITGALTAVRGPLTDTFDFTCSMDLRSGQVLNLQMNRR